MKPKYTNRVELIAWKHACDLLTTYPKMQPKELAQEIGVNVACAADFRNLFNKVNYPSSKDRWASKEQSNDRRTSAN